MPTSVPYHGRWSRIEVDQDDGAIVWSESDMTAAFIVFFSSPHGILSKQLTKLFLDPWPRHLISLQQMSLKFTQFCVSCLLAGRARAACSNIFIDGCVFCHHPRKQDLTPAGKYGATCRCHERWTKADRVSSRFT